MTVLNDEQVRDVVGELATLAGPGTVIAIHFHHQRCHGR